MPRLLAPSISSTSTSSPVLMLWQMSHWLQGVGGGAVLAIQGFGQDPRGGGLAHAPRPGEQIGVAHPVGRDRVPQRLGDVLLADQFREVCGRYRRATTTYGRGSAAAAGGSGLAAEDMIAKVMPGSELMRREPRAPTPRFGGRLRPSRRSSPVPNLFRGPR